jgi:deoxycytidylate deaminase
MSKAIDLSHIYQLRNDFTIIGLTGRTGSGCTEVANQLSKGFDEGKNFETPFSFGLNHNSYRKYRIIYDHAKINFLAFSLIKYKDVLILFLLEHSFEEFIQFLGSEELQKEFVDSKFVLQPDFKEEIEKLNELRQDFNFLSEAYQKIETGKLKEKNNWEEFYSFFFEGPFRELSNKIHSILKARSLLKRNKTLQVISNNLRKSGNPYRSDDLFPDKIDTIVELINDLIKSHRKKFNRGRTQIVIDSLRNPFEIMFFKQRFAAFYTIAVHREDRARKDSIISKNTEDNAKFSKDVEKLEKEEYKGGKNFEFFKQAVDACIQQADIHLSFLTAEGAAKKNLEKDRKDSLNPHQTDSTSPYFSWGMQLLKYVSLISHPGLVPPSPEERCMQLAYTAKHNSGCISRHVGAAITDENYSVKAIGWNNTPEGQVPCVLRNAEDLLNPSMDIKAFTPYERGDEDFNAVLVENFAKQIPANREKLKGRNVCFCFKCLKNSFSEGKNQVHTRSLHAEENAFLQLTKYGGTGIQGGKLFSTASPCELCSKKAYQLGIKVIYFIDPYPGISNKHILEDGTHPIEVRLFNGVIGKAYHWLYDPVMPYKDELTLLLGNEIPDLTSKYETKIEDQQKEIDSLLAKVKQLETN